MDASKDLDWQELASRDDREMVEEQLMAEYRRGRLTMSELELRKERLYQTRFLGEVFGLLVLDSSQLGSPGGVARHLIMVNVLGALAAVLLLFGAASASPPAFLALLAIALIALAVDVIVIKGRSGGHQRFAR